MKRILNFSIAFLWLGLTISFAQSTDSPKKSNTMDSQLLVCKLNGPELIQRKQALQKEVFSQMISYEELDKGFLFRFDFEENFLLKLTDYMLAEKKCCPFFQYELKIRAHAEGLELRVSGEGKAKEMLRSLMED
ncbi:MAG: hypothetical protein R8P61_19985 [Bacteroidia bacterium]|nr:hypothetical protein [Bacteroidia bacterium]